MHWGRADGNQTQCFCNNVCENPENLKIAGKNRLKRNLKKIERGWEGVNQKKREGGPNSQHPPPFPGIILNKRLLLLGQICVQRKDGGGKGACPPPQLPTTPPISVKEPHVLRGGGGGMDKTWGRGQKIHENQKKGGGVKTLSPSPLPRTSPNRQYAPYFVTKANLCTYTLKYRQA